MKQLYRGAVSAFLLWPLATLPAPAQTPPVPSTTEAQAAANPAPSAAYTSAQLDQLLAPIALYPDQLLTAVLMAATFPQQIVDAGKWLQDPANAALKGDALVSALQPLPWDPSVKSLVAFPQLIVMMSNHLDWTEAVGQAFAGNQAAVMTQVQSLRGRADAAGHLQSTPQLVVRHEGDYYYLDPGEAETIYVPIYNPGVIYGAWPDRRYPPVWLAPPPDFYVGAIGAGIGFSIGFGVVGPLWGWGHLDWAQHHVFVDPQRYNGITDTAKVTNKAVTIDNNNWHRTAAVERVPAAARPHRPTATMTQHPPGTMPSTAVHTDRRSRGPGDHPHPVAAGAAQSHAAAYRSGKHDEAAGEHHGHGGPQK